MSIRGNSIKVVEEISVRKFFDFFKDSIDLELISGSDGFDRMILEPTINRPALAITGYYKNFASSRIQLFGAGEMAYMRDLPGRPPVGRDGGDDRPRNPVHSDFAQPRAHQAHARRRAPAQDTAHAHANEVQGVFRGSSRAARQALCPEDVAARHAARHQGNRHPHTRRQRNRQERVRARAHRPRAFARRRRPRLLPENQRPKSSSARATTSTAAIWSAAESAS